MDQLEKLAANDSSRAEPAVDEIDEAAEQNTEQADDWQSQAALMHPDAAWYVVHTYSGYENKVKANLEKRVRSMGMENKIFKIVVPVEEQMEVKDGRRRIVQRRIFPGYVLVQLILTDDSAYVVRSTPGVTGFVGAGNRPTPLSQAEVEGILKQMGMERPKPKIDFEVGESIRVRSGPFEGFVGVIRGIDGEKGKIRVMVSMFGRETPVELDFSQVEKL